LKNGAAYAASKWGLNGMTYSVAEELRDYGIRVSAIAPGSVNTEFGGTPTGGSWKIQPEDVANVVALIVTQSPQSFVSEVLLRPARKA
jgi:3-oxoacyl-[acyl-carrier protein] reductase